MRCYAHIALPLPAARLFTYAVPEHLFEASSFGTSHTTIPEQPSSGSQHLIGCRALVPFGKRLLTGVIIDVVRHDSSTHDIKEIAELLDDTPIFSPTMLAFGQWIAEYYMASLGETLKAMLPQGMSPESVIRIRARQRPSDEELHHMEQRAPRRAALLRELLKHTGDISVGYLEHVVGGGALTAQLEALEREGFIERYRGMQHEIHAKTARAVRPSSALSDDETRRRILDELDRSAPKQALLLSHILLHYTAPNAVPLLAKEALTTVAQSALGQSTPVHQAFSNAVLKALLQKGYVEEFSVEVARTSYTVPPHVSQSLISKDERIITFSSEQHHALHNITEALHTHSAKTFLLYGVTGSGKTLIYLYAIREALRHNKTALVLVPEIALTPQLIERFRAFFGEDIGVLHSHTSVGERFDTWQRIVRGELRIVIGARSAIFAPLQNLGIIIVDEEHESSYKQDSPSPRYHARDCAVVRGKLERAVVVLGSATPSLESMFNAHSGKYHLLEITQRADGATMPSIHIVDIRGCRKQGKMRGLFSEDLLHAVAQRLQRKEGIIIFHNRRGFASRFECLDCGYVPMCPECSVPLTYHKVREQQRCHYCGYSRNVEKACTQCGSPDVKEIGAGTQRIEEDLHNELTQALQTYLRDVSGISECSFVIQRMDLDTTRKKGSHAHILSRFAKGEIDILLGTQMVAKGLDFARVSLVGVINADMHLYLPDFRAAERTFQLLTQVAGRAGRSSEFRGEVIIQTAHPYHQTIAAVEMGSYATFYSDELQHRRVAMYPPFARFVVIEFSGSDETLVQVQAQHFAYFLPHEHTAFTRLGPTTPTISRLRGRYRRIVVLKNYRDRDPSGKVLRSALLHAYAMYNKKYPSSAVRISIDVDAAGII
ncbi:MAG: primosomal protein N' [Bacteroidota bacterium]|nr:primosomal protein N' [Candidatus Kapabacteria bacterium]MDW8220154.1 primosomal protein N' [Bacteroidota bacterium]